MGELWEIRNLISSGVRNCIPLARAVIEAAQERNIDCIVAPYEADAQLAFLNMYGLNCLDGIAYIQVHGVIFDTIVQRCTPRCGLAQFVITEDSDLTLFGCDRVLFKLKDTVSDHPGPDQLLLCGSSHTYPLYSSPLP